MRVFTEGDLDRNLLQGSTVAVLGYGNQGRAHALNLRDSGVGVSVGARPDGEGWRRAAGDGFSPRPVAEAVQGADLVSILLPDEIHRELFEGEIEPNLAKGSSLLFAHGFSVAFGALKPPADHDVVLVAPKGQGRALRESYLAGRGVPCLVGVEVDASGAALAKALSYASCLGCLRIGALESSFREEAITDLFGEQAVLCGGVPELVKAAFETLVEAGYDPRLAYIECLHELKIITDLLEEGGIAHMRRQISKTAAWGSFMAGEKVVSAYVRHTLKVLLGFIESGEFAQEWLEEARSGQKRLRLLMELEAGHGIEEAGLAVRALMERTGAEQ